ncbi:MAG: BrnA antitoxin family protein [Acidobacteria bacterium]|nr:BrnA antitoxin family protein [Acidobacteriota bacterium]MBA4183714.1 BrnA antitoxin family protein [Acidobacteriota bacterium]
MSEQNSTQDISDKNEYILEITQEKYNEMKARGIDEEAIPSVGKHIFRRRTRKINPREAKIKMTMFIDYDILQHFRSRADKPNAAPYQIQINQELRAAMERDLAEEENKLDEVAKKLLSNPKFLEAISEKLKAA